MSNVPLLHVAGDDQPTHGHGHGHGHGSKHQDSASPKCCSSTTKKNECSGQDHGHGHGHGHEHGHEHGSKHNECSGHDHGHGHGHGSQEGCSETKDDHSHHSHHSHHAHRDDGDNRSCCADRSLRRLSCALVVCLLFAAVELVGGYIAGSLAIMTDAAHLLSDVASFGVSIFALCLVKRPATYGYTFGMRRAEAVGTLVSVLIIWLITGILMYEGVVRTQRIIANPQIKYVQGRLMFFVACGGVVVNVVLMCILAASGHAHSHGGDPCDHGHHSHGGGADDEERRSLVEQAAFIHAVGDLIQSFGVVVAGGLIWWKSDGDDGNGWWQLADPISTFFFGVLVLYTTKQIFEKVMRLFLMGSPNKVDVKSLVVDIEKLPFVHSAHDVHAFEVSSNFPIVIGHVVVRQAENYTDMLLRIKGVCLRHGIDHVTMQLEPLSGIHRLSCECPVSKFCNACVQSEE